MRLPCRCRLGPSHGGRGEVGGGHKSAGLRGSTGVCLLACAFPLPPPSRPLSRDYLWRPESSVLPQDVPLDKLPLPESTPADDEQQAAPVGADDS